MERKEGKIIFLIQCEDRKGILLDTVQWFTNRTFNILHCQQHTDGYESYYFMRIELSLTDLQTTRLELELEFDLFAKENSFNWSCHYSDYTPRVAILVSKTSHCLYDLIGKKNQNQLHCEIPIIISNHPNLENLANSFRIPYYYLPVDRENKKEQEEKVIELLKRFDIDLVVLARYMQILGEDFVEEYNGKIINIHHAFLPAFQGANPYQKAYQRGVKIIGATAHYASKDLDQGPIIEQQVTRVGHELTPKGLKEIGKDVEMKALSQAVQAHLESRIMIYKNRTIVFSPQQ